jgi:sensor domain CHASE-containing protein
MAAVFVITFLLLGIDLWSAVIVLIVVVMIVVSMLGMMVMWHISLNAIALVNLVMVRTHIFSSLRKKIKSVDQTSPLWTLRPTNAVLNCEGF